MKVKSRVVQLHAFSLPGYNLPTFSRATLKTVYRWKIPIRKYLVFYKVDENLQMKKQY